MRIQIRDLFDPGSGIRIEQFGSGSGINITDQQHCENVGEKPLEKRR
jgi:hypothetical protein